MVKKESTQILKETNYFSSEVISEKKLNHLPKIIQKWLRNSGVIGSPKIATVCLKQKGEIRTKPNGKWMSFKATQYFNVNTPSFVWTTNIYVMPIINMVGRDKFINGEGEMLIKLGAVIPLVNEGKNYIINSGTMIRFLSEICWFPSAALNDYIIWKTIDNSSAKATFTFENETVSGIFPFTKEGNLISFEAERYYGGKENSKLETWLIEPLSFKKFNNIIIPKNSKVTWKLKNGDFHWLNIEVIDIEYNNFL